jgi:hypothetical protein
MSILLCYLCLHLVTSSKAFSTSCSHFSLHLPTFLLPSKNVLSRPFLTDSSLLLLTSTIIPGVLLYFSQFVVLVHGPLKPSKCSVLSLTRYESDHVLYWCYGKEFPSPLHISLGPLRSHLQCTYLQVSEKSGTNGNFICYLLFTWYALYVHPDTLRIFSAALPCLCGFCSTYCDWQ